MAKRPPRTQPSHSGDEEAEHFRDAAVDRILAEWSGVLPKLDLTARAIAARIARIDSRLRAATAAALDEHELSGTEFRMLAGIMRLGPPYLRSPSELIGRYVPVTSGGLTGIINRLERRDLARRMAHPTDQRGVLIALTKKGQALTLRAMADVAEAERRLVGGLSEEERAEGNRILRKLLRSMDAADPSSSSI